MVMHTCASCCISCKQHAKAVLQESQVDNGREKQGACCKLPRHAAQQEHGLTKGTACDGIVKFSDAGAGVGQLQIVLVLQPFKQMGMVLEDVTKGAC